VEWNLLPFLRWLVSMEHQNSLAHNKHVLLVDDDIELALMYQTLLQEHGYQVSTAANGQEALKLVLKGDADAILCDLSMPELAGDLFYLEVGRIRPQLLKRFIFVTAHADNPLYETFLNSVKAPVLAKPVSTDRLLEKLQAILGPETVPAK
jgi:CheY-like chemotaxis protein